MKTKKPWIPKNGLLRGESSHAHKMTTAKRDKIATRLEKVLPKSLYDRITLHGCSVIRVYCVASQVSDIVADFLPSIGVHEVHQTKYRNSFCVIGVVR